MGEASRGDGWWMANDGQWYPPELHPDRLAAAPPPPAPDSIDSSGWWQDEDGSWQPPRAARPAPTARGTATVVGEAGGSAKRRAEQLKRDAERWETGGDGEARTAEALALLPHGFHVLHDLHVPGSRANIDHLVVGPTGVWLIDSKLYSAPLRFSDGKLWSGRHLVRDEARKVSDYARAVHEVLRVPVAPVLCFVDNEVPPESPTIGSVRAVSLKDLLPLVAGSSGIPVGDVESVARLARTLRTPTPAPARPRQRREPPQPEPTRTAPRRSGGRDRRSGGGRSASSRAPKPKRQKSRRKQPENGLFRAVGAILALLVIAAFLNSLSEASTNEPPPLDGPTIDTPTPLLRIGVTCLQRGAGYRVTLLWPTTLPTPEPVAFEVASVTPGITIEDELWTGRYDPPPPIEGVWPSTEVKVIVQGIAEDGTRLAPTASVRTTPDAPC